VEAQSRRLSENRLLIKRGGLRVFCVSDYFEYPAAADGRGASVMKRHWGCSGSGRSNLLKNKKIRPKNRRFQGLCRTFRHQKERYGILSFFHIAL